MATILQDLSLFKEALRVLHKALVINERQLGPAAVPTALCYHHTAMALSLMGAFPLAVRNEQRCYDILKSSLGDGRQEVRGNPQQRGEGGGQGGGNTARGAAVRACPGSVRALAGGEWRGGDGPLEEVGGGQRGVGGGARGAGSRFFVLCTLYMLRSLSVCPLMLTSSRAV